MSRTLKVEQESWPVAGSFRISRGAKTEAEVVVVEIAQGGAHGRGECVPYARYGETVAGVMAGITRHADAIAAGIGRADLQFLMPPGAARNAVDCALWDLEAKQKGTRAWQLAGIDRMEPATTAYTLSLAAPEAMAEAARTAADRPLIKIKLGQDGDEERLRAIREAAPRSQLIIDANEGWAADRIEPLFALCAEVGVTLIEQPLPAENDTLLADIAHPVPVCADEAVHGLDSLDGIAGRYDAINIKLDKTGGLTEALALCKAAEERDLDIMVGCMLATSLAMAPAMIVAQHASVVDLDGPLLLARDRESGITFDGSVMHPPPPELWG
ncbi:MAG: N-acetyl-D-Glu racemase DgcA [Hyphomicrobiales bacterium]